MGEDDTLIKASQYCSIYSTSSLQIKFLEIEFQKKNEEQVPTVMKYNLVLLCRFLAICHFLMTYLIK